MARYNERYPAGTEGAKPGEPGPGPGRFRPREGGAALPPAKKVPRQTGKPRGALTAEKLRRMGAKFYTIGDDLTGHEADLWEAEALRRRAKAHKDIERFEAQALFREQLLGRGMTPEQVAHDWRRLWRKDKERAYRAERKKRLEAEYYNEVQSEMKRARTATKGVFYSQRGYADAPKGEALFWTEFTAQQVQAYASRELKDFFQQHGRLTYASWYAGKYPSRSAKARAWASQAAGRGRDF